MTKTIQQQLAEIEKQIEKKLGKNGLRKVAEVIRETGEKQVKETVYNAYTPTLYQRTGELQRNWTTEYISPLSLNVISDKWDFGRYVSEIVETGVGYSYTSPTSRDTYEKPRPFVQNTYNELYRNKKHVKAVCDCFNDVGIKTRIIK